MATQQQLLPPLQSLALSHSENLTSDQSLALVEIFINATIACICHARELLPWDSACFQTRHTDDLRSKSWQRGKATYSSFCNQAYLDATRVSQEFRLLQRGRDKRADQILDLVENGVFAALEGGYLNAVRFFITRGVDETNSADLLDCYILTFSYEEDASHGCRVKSVSVNSGPDVSTENAVRTFKKAIRSLLRSVSGLTLIPHRRSLGVALLYNTNCPSSYEIPGFLSERVVEKDDKHCEMWEYAENVGELEAGRYRVIVAASFPQTSPAEPTSSELIDLATRRQLQAMQKSSSQQQSDLISTLDYFGSHNASGLQISQGRQFDPRSRLRQHQSRMPTPDQQASPAFTFSTSSTAALTKGSRKRNVVPTKLAELVIHACALENSRRGIGSIRDFAMLEENKIVHLNMDGDHCIRCECGDSSGRNDDSLFCNLCGTWQHLTCYGYKDFRPTRLPDEHFCYTCLLLPMEAMLNTRMPHLVLMRLALGYILEKPGVDRESEELVAAMHLERKEIQATGIVNSVIDQLEDEGYVTRNGTLIAATTDTKKLELANAKYTSPLAQISHHFVTLKDGETARAREEAIAEAVEKYTAGRNYRVGKADAGVDYDAVTVEDATGNLVQRFGYYPGHKRSTKQPPKRRANSPAAQESSPKRSMARSAIRCEQVVCLDRSSSLDAMNLEE